MAVVHQDFTSSKLPIHLDIKYNVYIDVLIYRLNIEFPVYEHFNVYMILMDGKFTRKPRLVVDGHTAPSSSIKFSSVVSRESVRISFLLAYLNYLYVFTFDIGNAYLNEKFIEKLWTEAGT